MFNRNQEKRFALVSTIVAVLAYVTLSIVLFFFHEGRVWVGVMMSIRYVLLGVAFWYGRSLWMLYLLYVSGSGDKYFLRFRSFLLARDVDSSHRRVNLAERERIRAKYGRVKTRKDNRQVATPVLPSAETSLSTEERHRRKIAELVADLRSITLPEHEEQSEVIISRTTDLPFEEARSLLVKSYQEQREKNRKTLAIITGDNELVVH